MKILKLPLDWFVTRLGAKVPTTFARYGDGEFAAILGEPGHNCDGQEYHPNLGQALKLTLTKPGNYKYAIGPKAAAQRTSLSARAMVWLKRNAPRLDWWDSEVFLAASLKGELNSLINVLLDLNPIIVGPDHLYELSQVLDARFVHVPLPNAWDEVDEIHRQLLIESHLGDTILFSAGPTSKVLIHRLFHLLGGTHSLLDMGSVWDMYCGKPSRTYARRLAPQTIERLRQQNFGSLVFIEGQYAITT